MFEKVTEGEKDLPTLINEATKDRCACLFFKSQESKAAQGGRPKVTQRVSPSAPPKMWMKKRAKRRGQFLRFQRLFYLDRGKLASIILDDVESLRCGIPLDDIHAVFKSRWEVPGTFKGLGAFVTVGQADNSTFEAMVTAKEVSKNINEMNKNVAPGPDGLRLRDLIKTDPHYTQLMAGNRGYTGRGERVPDGVNIQIDLTGAQKGHQ